MKLFKFVFTVLPHRKTVIYINVGCVIIVLRKFVGHDIIEFSFFFIQGVWGMFYILIFCYFCRLVGGIYTHYASFESLAPSSFIYLLTARMD